MFILEEPYVSTLLADTVTELRLPVLDTPKAREALEGRGVHLSGDEAFANVVRMSCGSRLYANSENAIGWIAQNLGDTALPAAIDLFKDKVRFRDLVADLYPDYRYAGVALADLGSFDITALRLPIVVKPAVGFFSMGVHVVDAPGDWPRVVAQIEREVRAFAEVYPEAVLALDRFVLEEVIEGEEFAIDAYFDSKGEPVIVNVFGHLFASAHDVSDRVYYTTVDVVDRHRARLEKFLQEVGERAGLRDFPMHAEVRIDAGGTVAPIEINPMRFGGWCATDLAYHAYGINPYRAYLHDVRPDWDAIRRERAGRMTAMVVADLPSSVDLSAIESVDYDAFAARFSRVLELRPTDFARYPVFAFTFVDVPADDPSELHAVLGADLRSYLAMRG